jgi:hypothetical protein
MLTLSSSMRWVCISAAVDLLNYGFLSVVNWTYLEAVVFGQLVERNDEKKFVFSDDSIFQT